MIHAIDSMLAWKIPALARWRVVGVNPDGTIIDMDMVRFIFRHNAERWRREATADALRRYGVDPNFTVMRLRGDE